MTEQEKRLAGKLYYPPDPELTEARMRAKRLCHRLNALAPDDFQGRDSTIRELFGRAGKDAWVESNFRCDYGTQISVGDPHHHWEPGLHRPPGLHLHREPPHGSGGPEHGPGVRPPRRH